MAHHILDHHDRAIDDHAEVQRAQGKQIGRNVAEVETDCGKQKRKGNGERDDDRAAHIPQEQKENDGNKDDSRGQIVLDSFHCEGDQIGTIEERNNLDSLGQNPVR